MSGASSERFAKKGPRRHVWKSGGSADWAARDCGRILAAVACIAANGGAVRLGYTRDSGAYAVGVYGDGEFPYTDYLKPGDDIERYFDELALTFNPERPGDTIRSETLSEAVERDIRAQTASYRRNGK